MDNVSSTAVQVLVTIIPMVGIVMGSVVILLYIIFNYKQKKLMIEKITIIPKSTFTPPPEN